MTPPRQGHKVASLALMWRPPRILACWRLPRKEPGSGRNEKSWKNMEIVPDGWLWMLWSYYPIIGVNRVPASGRTRTRRWWQNFYLYIFCFPTALEPEAMQAEMNFSLIYLDRLDLDHSSSRSISTQLQIYIHMQNISWSSTTFLSSSTVISLSAYNLWMLNCKYGVK